MKILKVSNVLSVHASTILGVIVSVNVVVVANGAFIFTSSGKNVY